MPSQEEATRKTYEALILLNPKRASRTSILRTSTGARSAPTNARAISPRPTNWATGVPGCSGITVGWRVRRQGQSAASVSGIAGPAAGSPGCAYGDGFHPAEFACGQRCVQTLAPVKTVTPQDAPRLLTLLAYANLEAGNRETAEKAANQLKKVATKPEERDQADRVLNYLEQTKPGASRPAPVVTREQSDARPDRWLVATHRHRPSRRNFRRGPRSEGRPSAGNFVALECGQQARIVIQTPQGRKRFLIEDPTKLLLNGGGQTMDLTCGPQKPVQVTAEYDPPGPSHPGIDGLLRVINFE